MDRFRFSEDPPSVNVARVIVNPSGPNEVRGQSAVK
jgi:hypothetical protein